MKQLTFVLIAALAACGGSDTPAPEAPSGDNDGDGDGHHAEGTPEHQAADGEKHEHNFPPMVDAFHNVLKVNWHMDAGDERTDKTCAAIESLKTAASDVKSGELPEKVAADADGWNAATEDLATQVDLLAANCAAGDAERANFDAAFTKVHDSFHVLIEKLGDEKK